jgi:phosphoribosylformimino-5-aminoimidazole carboxamide ribotide isomerase
LEIIPAIDIKEGRCVRLLQGDFDHETVYSEDPVEMALRWESGGAPRLHVVDLDGARTGEPHNIKLVERIAKAVKIPIQVGGGIRSMAVVRAALEAGAQRVVIGTSAALHSELAVEMLDALRDRAIVGIDARDGYVAIRGWAEVTGEKAADFAKRMESLGAPRIVFTDISKDGMLQGISLDATAEIADAVNLPVIASGGVTNVEDIKALVALNRSNIEGVITGKALYAGTLTLSDALAAAK